MIRESTETKLRRGNAAGVGGAGGVKELAVVGESESREEGCADCLSTKSVSERVARVETGERLPMMMRKATISAQESWDHEALHPCNAMVRLRKGSNGRCY